MKNAILYCTGIGLEQLVSYLTCVITVGVLIKSQGRGPQVGLFRAASLERVSLKQLLR